MHLEERCLALPLQWDTSVTVCPFSVAHCQPLFVHFQWVTQSVLKEETFNLVLFCWCSHKQSHSLVNVHHTALILGGKEKNWRGMFLKITALEISVCVHVCEHCSGTLCVSLYFHLQAAMGFIPAVAFYQREHQSARLTFNPKTGHVEKNTYART